MSCNYQNYQKYRTYLTHLLYSLSSKFNGEVTYDYKQNIIKFRHDNWNCSIDMRRRINCFDIQPELIPSFAIREAYCILDVVVKEWDKQIKN